MESQRPATPLNARRRFVLGVAALVLALSAFTALAGPLEGQWGGVDGQGRTSDITVVGAEVVGFSFGFEYFDVAGVKFSEGGQKLDFTFAEGSVSVTRVGAGARIVIRRLNGPPVSIAARRG